MDNLTPPAAWSHLRFFNDQLPAINAALAAETRQILPPRDQVFAAFDRCRPDQVRVVILGQDPYPTPGHAHGLSFSVEPQVRPRPRSLNNIFKEMEADLGQAPLTGDLRFWTDQGVLLLNTCLTVPAGLANGHSALGWQALATQVLQDVSQRPTAFVLWGKQAQGLARHIASPKNGAKHFVIESAHPSPLSARRGFFGSRPFSRINAWLADGGLPPINWTQP